jgi:hypothetical protein
VGCGVLGVGYRVWGDRVFSKSTIYARAEYKSCTTPTATAANVAGYDGTTDKTATSTISFKCTKSTVGTVNLKSTIPGEYTDSINIQFSP